MKTTQEIIDTLQTDRKLTAQEMIASLEDGALLGELFTDEDEEAISAAHHYLKNLQKETTEYRIGIKTGTGHIFWDGSDFLSSKSPADLEWVTTDKYEAAKELERYNSVAIQNKWALAEIVPSQGEVERIIFENIQIARNFRKPFFDAERPVPKTKH